MRFRLLIGTTNMLKLDKLRDTASGGTYENSATVQATLYSDRAMSSEVSGQSWPATLSYVAASDGQYEGFLEDDLSVTEGTDYYAKVVANAGANKVRTWRLKVRAEYSEK